MSDPHVCGRVKIMNVGGMRVCSVGTMEIYGASVGGLEKRVCEGRVGLCAGLEGAFIVLCDMLLCTVISVLGATQHVSRSPCW